MPTLQNVQDLKDKDGCWVKSYMEVIDGTKFNMRTRGSMVWNNMSNRCLEGGAAQAKNECYTVCTNGFSSYQDFVGWCQDQYGYWNRNPNGKFWSLDKDILVHGNKTYSPDTCLFVPETINGLFMGTDRARGSLPIGVRLHEKVRSVRYRAGCRQKDGTIYTKLYDTPEEAHAAWQLAKIERIWEESADCKEHPKLYQALMVNIERINDDYQSNRETKVAWWSHVVAG